MPNLATPETSLQYPIQVSIDSLASAMRYINIKPFSAVECVSKHSPFRFVLDVFHQYDDVYGDEKAGNQYPIHHPS